MTISIAHLGPTGTFSEFAAAAYANDFAPESVKLQGYSTIAQAIYATAKGDTQFCVVPVENSIGGGVTITLDTLWEVDALKIQQAFTLPVQHALISKAAQIGSIETVYSHPQALAQCRDWLSQNLPHAKQVRASSTAEPLNKLENDITGSAIASPWGAKIYNLPVLAHPINDSADNYTRFWVLGKQLTKNAATDSQYTSLAFSLRTNEPGALLKPLQLFSALNINMIRIESRPTKRLLGEYIFFVDVEASANAQTMHTALDVLKLHTATLKIFGSYSQNSAQRGAGVGL
ncbi:MAG: prephenate dehydratase [Cyanobacteria bacterium J06554_11]